MATSSIERLPDREHYPPVSQAHSLPITGRQYDVESIPRSMAAVDLARSSPSPTVVSSGVGMLHVFGYTPAEGEQDVPITVHINFTPNCSGAVYVRLVVGRKAVATQVRQLINSTMGKWQLEAAAPRFDKQNSASAKVLLTVQALNDQNSILDSVTFGEFTYWESGGSLSLQWGNFDPHSLRASADLADRQCLSTLAKRPRKDDLEELKNDTVPAAPPPEHKVPPRKHTFNGFPSPPATATDRGPPARPRTRKQMQRRIKPQALMRTKHVESSKHPYAQKATLELLTSLDSVCHSWDESEIEKGRRLVRFKRQQRGHRLKISCEPVPQDDYSSSDIVISCIYREEANQFFVTSVDIIYLLEKLVDSHFEVEEKNRIRRNLEGLKPVTVSKNRPGFEAFFQLIMDFPDPRPRNIEKDLKVFEWKLLAAALDKIISKYSLYSDVPYMPDDPPAEGAPAYDPTQNDITPLIQVASQQPSCVPRHTVEQHVPAFEESEIVAKTEPLSDEMQYMALTPTDSLYYPIADPPICGTVAAGQMCVPEPIVEYDSSGGSWFSGDGFPDLDASHAFEVVHMAYPDDGYGSASFNSIEFQTLRESHLHSDGMEYC